MALTTLNKLLANQYLRRRDGIADDLQSRGVDCGAAKAGKEVEDEEGEGEEEAPVAAVGGRGVAGRDVVGGAGRHSLPA